MPPALRYRDFRVFCIGLALSGFGSQFSTVAMAWQIYELTRSPIQLGLLGLTRALPQMALALVGGLLADRYDRRRLLMAAQLAQFAVSATLLALTLAGVVTPLALYLASGLLAVGTALETPSRQAIIPDLVPADALTSALALNQTLRNTGAIVGPAVAGILIAAGGVAACYGIDALSWLAMLVALLLISGVGSRLPSVAASPWTALREGLRFVWTHPVLLSLMALDFGATLFGEARALYPIYAREILRVGPEGLGALYTASAAGTVAAALVMARMGRVHRAGVWTLWGVAVYGACTVAFALSPAFWFSLLMLAGSGAGNLVSAVLRGTINQLSTPPALRGRVSAVNTIFVQGGPQLGSSSRAWWRR
ncbi:MAG: MFS transporter [Dehalococcoidia bacterium]